MMNPSVGRPFEELLQGLLILNRIGIKRRGISPDRGGIIIAQGIALGTQTP
jgi:hypothetical protein